MKHYITLSNCSELLQLTWLFLQEEMYWFFVPLFNCIWFHFLWQYVMFSISSKSFISKRYLIAVNAFTPPDSFFELRPVVSNPYLDYHHNLRTTGETTTTTASTTTATPAPIEFTTPALLYRSADYINLEPNTEVNIVLDTAAVICKAERELPL